MSAHDDSTLQLKHECIPTHQAASIGVNLRSSTANVPTFAVDYAVLKHRLETPHKPNMRRCGLFGVYHLGGARVG